MTHRLPLVYIAGPYTGGDPVQNTRRAIETATRLAEGGLVVPLIPHLSLLWDLVAPQPPEFWYDYDLHLLDRCDALYRLTGESKGADNEVQHAYDLGIPVFFEGVGGLSDWAQEWSAL